MLLDSKLLKSIDESKYLSTENTWRYRPIIRMFYKHYEKMKYWLYKEDIYEDLKKYEQFKDYTIDNLKYDLDALVQNKNLLTLQDTSKVKSVEEFKNKQFRYQLSKYTIEIERLVIKLENLETESGASLESSLIERFKENLEKVNSIKFKGPKEVYDWWNSLNNDFKNLNENYQDYIRGFYSLKAEELMQTTEFLVFKERLIQYLRDFIKGLQINAFIIENILKDIQVEDIKELISKVLVYEKTIPRIEYIIIDDEFIGNNIGRWDSINEWFLSNGFKNSDCERLMDFTNEIIMKITRYAAQISERKNSSASRKMEYRKLLKLFQNCSDINEAHKLSAVTIGVFNMRHIKGNSIRETESTNSSIYEEKPYKVTIKPRTKTYREKITKTAIKDKSEIKLQKQKLLIKQREDERNLIEALIVENEISFQKLPVLKAFERHTLLRWVSKGNSNKNKKARTEYGRDYSLISPENNETVILKCEDGEFRMPAYIIKFE